MHPKNVAPKAWSDITLLFNDNYYSAIWGFYFDKKNNSKYYCLGIRWNGEQNSEKGFPLSSGHPMWFVVPNEITLGILQNLLLLSSKRGNEEFEENIKKTIKTFINDEMINN